MGRNGENDRRLTQLLHQLSIGMLIGLTCIMPGVSGGVMAVSFGVYQPILEAVSHFFCTPRRSISFLLPYLLSASAGIFVGAAVISHVLAQYYVQTVCLFIGLVLGGVPSYLREANADGFHARYLAALIGGAVLAAGMMLLDGGDPSESGQALETLLWWQALAAGAIVAFGTIIPGVSMSFILMILGWYQPVIAAIAKPNLPILAFLAGGAVLAGIGCIEVMVRLFRRFSGYTHYAVLGFLCITTVLAFPDLPGYPDVVPCLMLIAGGILASGLLMKNGVGAEKVKTK